MRMQANVLAEPPEGVVKGEDVPVENQKEEMEKREIDEMVEVMKTHPAYDGKKESELREIAKEKLQ
jgi:hypothetical protein